MQECLYLYTELEITASLPKNGTHIHNYYHNVYLDFCVVEI